MDVILGDNPFFGVNHISQSTAHENFQRVDRFDNASNVIAESVRRGVREFMVSTHADLPLLLNTVQASFPEEAAKLELLLVTPYAQKLNNIVGERGLIGLVSQVANPWHFFSYFFDILKLFSAGKIPSSVVRDFFVQDLDIRSDIEVTTICLHNVVADLLFSFKSKALVEEVVENLQRITDARLVVITQNPCVADSLLPKSIPICFSYNAAGFMVNPDLTSVRQMMTDTTRELWGMSLFASGYLSADEVLEDRFLASFSKVVYATSKVERLKSAITQFESI